MKLIILAIGSKHDLYVKTGVEGFTSRIQHYFPCEWRIVPPSKLNGNADQVRMDESSVIQAIWEKEKAFHVLLDERGSQLTSPGFADCIARAGLESRKAICFTIGGAFGVDEMLRKKANLVMSLGMMVFPHQLVRLMLAEQIYRACTINRGEKYHHI